MKTSERVAEVIATMTTDELRAQYDARIKRTWPDEYIGFEKTKPLYELDGLIKVDVFYEFLEQAEKILQEIQTT